MYFLHIAVTLRAKNRLSASHVLADSTEATYKYDRD